MTPLYDVLSAWPIIGGGANRIPYQRAKLAMGVKATNMHYRLKDIQPLHWQRLATTTAPGAWLRMLAMAERLDEALDAVGQELPEGFPVQVWESVRSGMKRHAALFLNAVTAKSAAPNGLTGRKPGS